VRGAALRGLEVMRRDTPDQGAIEPRGEHGPRSTVLRRWPLILGVITLVAGVGLTIAAARGFGFSDTAAAETAAKPDTAEVTKQTLVETTEKTGALAYAAESKIRGAAGTVTWLPELGSTIERGGVLLKVNQTPMVLLYGGIPAYRALEPGVEGDDVRQFEENLAALGYTGFDVDTKYRSATAEAVEKWQKDLGVEKTGVVTSDFVHYAAGPVQVTARSAALGDPSGGAELLTVSSRERTATVDLESSESGYAVIGSAVTVTPPGGQAVPGTVASVESAVTNDAQGQKTTTLKVTVKPDDPAAITVTGASTAKIAFTLDRRDDVLAVPVNALLALAEGGYAVEVVDSKKGAAKGTLVGVETGLFAGGLVEVSGDGIAEGTKVVVPSS